MTSSPLNPFTLVTSHLDNSVIFWDLMGFSDIFLSEMKVILDMGLLEVTTDIHDAMLPGVQG
jgi:hypothetical protein